MNMEPDSYLNAWQELRDWLRRHADEGYTVLPTTLVSQKMNELEDFWTEKETQGG